MREGWEIKSLNEVCQIRPPKKEAKEIIDEDEIVSFVPMDTLSTNEKYFIPQGEKKLKDVISAYTFFKDNDVLLAKITPCFENGKLGIAKNLKNGIGFGSSEFIVYRPSNILNSDFLFYYLGQTSFRNIGASRMTGAVGHKRIPKDFYEDFPIPIPPLLEQQQIVAILDKAFAAIDQAKANVERNLQNAKELFQSRLNDVFSHKGDGWVEKKLGDVCENLDSMRVPITKNKRLSGDIPYYGASGVVDYVADHIFDENLLLVSEDGANLLARTYPIAFSVSGKIWVNNHAHVLKFVEIAHQKFIEYYLNSIKLDDYVSGMAQPKLNQKMLNTIVVPYPSLEIQSEVVDSLDKLSELSKHMETIYKNKLKALSELKKSLLQRAFCGELTHSTNEVAYE